MVVQTYFTHLILNCGSLRSQMRFVLNPPARLAVGLAKFFPPTPRKCLPLAVVDCIAFSCDARCAQLVCAVGKD